MLGRIHQAVVICLHSAVLPFHMWRLSLLDCCSYSTLPEEDQWDSRVSAGCQLLRAPLSSTFCGFCHLKAQCELWAQLKLFFTLDRSLRSSCSCCGDSPSFGTLHGLCWQHCRDVSWMDVSSLGFWDAVQSSWSPMGSVCTQLLWYSCT